MDVEDLRLLVYDSFRQIGRVPTNAEMATALDVTERREPSEAKDYFRSVGLNDPFWGT